QIRGGLPEGCSRDAQTEERRGGALASCLFFYGLTLTIPTVRAYSSPSTSRSRREAGCLWLGSSGKAAVWETSHEEVRLGRPPPASPHPLESRRPARPLPPQRGDVE